MRRKPNPDDHEGEESAGFFESGHPIGLKKKQVKREPILEVKRV